MQSFFDLAGKVALVTGGGSGIGRSIAEGLAGAGAQVVLCGRRPDPLRQAADGIGKQAAAMPGDVSDIEGIADLARQAGTPFGPPDILVNGAGINLRQAAHAITAESWDRTLDLNLKAPFFLAQALVPAMQARGWGRIINIASLQSERAFPNGLAYGASKGGLAQLTRAMAEAWSAGGIGCNAIAPGFFPTDLTAAVFDDPAREATNAAQTAIGRNGRMEDLHGIAIFLASQASDYITGQVIYLDGGYTAK